MRIGSLFSGAGGLDMAVEAVFGGRTVWHCEVDLAASKVLAHRWPGVPNYGDVSKVCWGVWKEHTVDILCGGFPCQDVSAAGRRAGIKEGTRSGLWTEFARAIFILRPRIVVIENVRGLLSARAHRAMESADPIVGDSANRPLLRAAGAVLGDLADLGFDAEWTTLAASSVGAPHRRERVFIVAYPAGDRRHQGRPEPTRLERGPHAPVGGSEPVELLLPTPCAQNSGNTPENHLAKKPGLHGDVIYRGDLLPTPSTADGDGGHLNRSGARSAELLLPGVARAYENGDLLPTPEAKNAHAGPDYARMSREGSGGHDLVTALAYHEVEASRWGRYAPAIERWEALTRPAPSPTEPNSKGNPRLHAPFAEWMQGWPAGWCTDPALGLTRNEQLRIIGNGVVPQQAIAALRYLLSVCEVAA